MRKFTHRPSAAAVIPASLALIALFAAPLASASEAAKPGCRQETRRVVIWPSGSPKAVQMPRNEERVVTVCDGKVVAQTANTEGKTKK